MATRRTRKRRAGRKSRAAASNIAWGALLVALVGIGIAGGYFAWSYASSRPSIDEATLCPDTGPTGALVVLLDLTDPLTQQQGARLRTLLEDRIANLPQDTMISFGVVSNDEARRGTLYASCKPADGSEASQIYENPTLIAERFEEDFMRPLRAGLDEAMRAGVEDRSPIMESLQTLIAETPAFETSLGTHELIIVSDLLQHSETLSFYRGEGWEELRASGGTERLARNLDGAWVSVLRVPRPGASALAREQVDAFWARYFDMQGARAPISVEVLGDL
jgi:hypothetical protein